jgi:hypothetical protein
MYHNEKIQPEREMASGFDIPPAQTVTQAVTGAFKEERALLPVDDDGVTVQQRTAAGGTEGTDFVNIEMTPVRPENGTGLHITGGIEVGRDFDVNTVWHKAPPFISIHHE